jgi:CNH domain
LCGSIQYVYVSFGWHPSLIGCQDDGRQVAYGTDDGVYFSDLRELNREPMKVVGLMDVAQLDILDEYQLLIVLSGMFMFWIRHYDQLPDPH